MAWHGMEWHSIASHHITISSRSNPIRPHPSKIPSPPLTSVRPVPSPDLIWRKDEADNGMVQNIGDQLKSDLFTGTSSQAKPGWIEWGRGAMRCGGVPWGGAGCEQSAKMKWGWMGSDEFGWDGMGWKWISWDRTP